MRIGYDVRALRANRSGVATYVNNLYDALQKMNFANDLYYPLDISLRLPRKNLFTKIGNALLDIFYYNFFIPIKARQLRLDIVHFPANMGSVLLSTPSVITIHDTMAVCMPENFDYWYAKYFRFFLPLVAQRAKKIITVSYSAKNDIVKHFGVKDEKIHVIYEGVSKRLEQHKKDVSFLERKYGIDDRPIILCVGELNARKNILNLIGGFLELRKMHSQISPQLVFVGDIGNQKYYQQILAYIEQEKVKSDIHFVGYIPTDHLSVFYAGASVLAFVSYYEGFGLPAVEAMANGVPILASKTSSLPEIMGNAGVFVDPSDIVDISNGLYKILTDQKFCQNLINAGYNRVQMFRWDEAAKNTHGIYVSLIENRL